MQAECCEQGVIPYCTLSPQEIFQIPCLVPFTLFASVLRALSSVHLHYSMGWYICQYILTIFVK